MNVIQRMAAPTPPFFKTLRNIGAILAAIGGSLLAAHASLPPAVVTAAGYLVVAGSVTGAVSQATVANDQADQPTTGANGQ